jgi:hypothetical protein
MRKACFLKTCSSNKCKSWRYTPDEMYELVAMVGRRTLTPPDPQLPIADRRLVSNLAPVK